MANSLMSFFSGMGGGNGGVMLKAVGAFMRGESPRDFLRTLANTNPALKGIDLNDISGSAQKICRERGVDPDKLADQIKQNVPGIK